MISNWATHIAERLCKEHLISATDQDLYTYGFFLLISKVFFFVVTALWGLLLNVLWESVVFYIAFSVLRQYAGGYHAPKESICMISTNILLFSCILSIRLAEIHSNITIGLCVLLISSITIFFLCPIDTANKPLNKSEKLYYKCIASFILLFFIVSASIAAILQADYLVHVLSVCTLIESILLIIGRTKRYN